MRYQIHGSFEVAGEMTASQRKGIEAVLRSTLTQMREVLAASVTVEEPKTAPKPQRIKTTKLISPGPTGKPIPPLPFNRVR